MTIRDLSGMKFGRLTAVTRIDSLSPGDGFRWECVCDCGGRAVVKTRLLTYKNGTRSCGCLLAEINRTRPVRTSTNLRHGHTSRGMSPEYICWASMIQRCTNQKHMSFRNYGARGVTVCPEWKDSFEHFLSDMGGRPEGTSLDRVYPNGNYTADNCRWATNVEQALNRRNSRLIQVEGVAMSCDEAAIKYGIPARTFYRWGKEVVGDLIQKVNARHKRATHPASF